MNRSFGRKSELANNAQTLLAAIRAAPHDVCRPGTTCLSPPLPSWDESAGYRATASCAPIVCATGDGYSCHAWRPDAAVPAPETIGRLHAKRRRQQGYLGAVRWPRQHRDFAHRLPPVVRIERRASEVPSRMADNLFWLGRYAERLEDNARLLRVAVARRQAKASAKRPPN